MKSVLSIVFGGLVLMTVVAWWLRPPAATDGKIPLTWVSDHNPARQEQIRVFNQLNPAVHLTLDQNNNGLEKVIVQSSSGVGPDLCDSYGGEQLQTLVEAGVAWDVTPVAPAMGFAATDKTWPGVVGEITYQGRQYSYPCNVNVSLLIYNKNVFDAAGVPYPRPGMTWAELIALAGQVTHVTRTGSDTIYGIGGLHWSEYFESRHGQYFSEDGTRLLIRDPIVQRAFELHRDCIFRWRIMPTSLELTSLSGQGGWGTGAINLFADGRFAMIVIGKWSLINFRRAHAHQVALLQRWEADPHRQPSERPAVLRLGAVPLPHFAGAPPWYRVSSRSAVVNAASPHRTEALKFLQYLAGPEYSRLLNQGVDSLPGNPQYANLGIEAGVPDLAELELHKYAIASLAHGYEPRFSPFLLTSDVLRVLTDQIGRLESDPQVPIADLLADAEAELVSLMQRNLNRNPALRARYRALTGTTDVAAWQRQAVPALAGVAR